MHLIPQLGAKRLDEINNEAVQSLKQALGKRSPKTVNNVLSVLNRLLKAAVDWGVIERMPCAIRLLPVPQSTASFHDFGDYERLVSSASDDELETLVVLLAGEAGLRCGEIMALEWGDVDLAKRQLSVQRSEWKRNVTVPKGGRQRHVPMTERLTAALMKHKHGRGPRVVCGSEGLGLTQREVQGIVNRAARRANLENRGVHVLRHTFCSHLATGAPARAIQHLAGHRDLVTTQRYMHVSPAAIEDAIRLLEPRKPVGDIAETGQAEG